MATGEETWVSFFLSDSWRGRDSVMRKNENDGFEKDSLCESVSLYILVRVAGKKPLLGLKWVYNAMNVTE